MSLTQKWFWTNCDTLACWRQWRSAELGSLYAEHLVTSYTGEMTPNPPSHTHTQTHSYVFYNTEIRGGWIGAGRTLGSGFTSFPITVSCAKRRDEWNSYYDLWLHSFFKPKVLVCVCMCVIVCLTATLCFWELKGSQMEKIGGIVMISSLCLISPGKSGKWARQR